MDLMKRKKLNFMNVKEVDFLGSEEIHSAMAGSGGGGTPCVK
jgi:hypothetical protein